jgi:hypothetical protein
MFKTNTWLPVFSGFYGTIFQPDYDYITEDLKELQNADSCYSSSKTESELATYIKNHNSAEIQGIIEKFIYNESYDYLNNERYETAVCKKACSAIKDLLIEHELVTNLKYQKIVSPKYYNFSNDSINISITLTNKNIENIKKIIKENYYEWTDYLKDTYTSRPGFASWHDNFPESEEWNIETALQDEHNTGSILEFILKEILNIDDEWLYYSIHNDGHVLECDYFNYASFFRDLLKEIKNPEKDRKEFSRKYQEFRNFIDGYKENLSIDRNNFKIFIPAIHFSCAGKLAETYIKNN